MKHLKVLLLMLLLSLFTLTACSDESTEPIEKLAKTYTEHFMKGNWEEVAKLSTGEQLSGLLLLSDALTQTQFFADVRLVEVMDASYTDDHLAQAKVHVVRNVEVEGFGRVTDDRQLLLSMYEVDGEWKVYKAEVIFENY